MRAIVVVGGAGTRLRPLTEALPKALVPIANRPLLERLLGWLAGHGIREVTLAVTAESAAIREALGDGSGLGLSLAYSVDDPPLGSAGAVARAAVGWREPFLVLNGDLVTDLDLTAMRAAHAAAGAALTMSVREVADASAYGVMERDGSRWVRSFREKPGPGAGPGWINSGVWLFDPALVERLRADAPSRLEETLFPALAAEGRLLAFAHAGLWFDVGTPAHYLAANLAVAAREAPDGICRGEGCLVDASAELRGPLVLGAGCRVGAGARLSRCVVWPGVRVPDGAAITDAVVMAGADGEAVVVPAGG